MSIIVLVGAQACGKTRNAEKLCKLLDYSTFVDEDDIHKALIEAKYLVTHSHFQIRNSNKLRENPHYNKRY